MYTELALTIVFSFEAGVEAGCTVFIVFLLYKLVDLWQFVPRFYYNLASALASLKSAACHYFIAIPSVNLIVLQLGQSLHFYLPSELNCLMGLCVVLSSASLYLEDELFDCGSKQ